MSHVQIPRRLVVFIAAICSMAACAHPAYASGLSYIDSALAVSSADGATAWYNALDIGIEGQGWTGLKHPYDRLPAEAEGKVPDSVWNLSHHSAGLNVRFITDSPTVSARWSVRNDNLAMVHMPATGVSGVDLYARSGEMWGWVGAGRPTAKEGNEAVLLNEAPPGLREYRLYLPLYNGTESLEIGVKPGSVIAKGSAYDSGHAKPILFWGTSILHGGCASRPGMAYPSIIGRQLNRPTINLGFSGNGKMDPPLVELISRLEVAAFVIDCAPNMTPELITERTEPLVQTIRNAQPKTPIVLVENVPYQQGWYVESRRKAYEDKNAALRSAYKRLRGDHVRQLFYVPCDDLFGDDFEATVDGTHATDLGFLRMADEIGPRLKRILR